MYDGNTEESFVLSNLKEFVNIWGSGGRAKLNLECRKGSMWIKLSAQLGHPAAFHCHPHQENPHPAQEARHHHHHKGPARHEKDHQRAVAHMARLVQLSAAAQSGAPCGPTTSVQTAASAVAPPPAASAGSEPSPDKATASSTPSPPPAATAALVSSPPPSATAGSTPTPPPAAKAESLPAPPAEQGPTSSSFHDVQDVLCPDRQYQASHAQRQVFTLADFMRLIEQKEVALQLSYRR